MQTSIWTQEFQDLKNDGMKRGLLPPREKKDSTFVQQSKPPDNLNVNAIISY
jgi:hypothetical protein